MCDLVRHSLQLPVRLDMNTNARIDSLQLMLTDLRMRNEPIRHKAAFRGCQPEFQALVSHHRVGFQGYQCVELVLP